MLRPVNLPMHPFRALHQQPWALSSAIPPRIDPSSLVEEENSPYYTPPNFIPRKSVRPFMTGIRLRPILGMEADRRCGLQGTSISSSNHHLLSKHCCQSKWRWSNERYVAVKIKCQDHPQTTASDVELEIM
ncbi:hypothetical protein BDW59DRAFT_153090 [Aspergillus cavernicola]|uniref:Uncharacterized protein n=1 Tax=Aspergillus cavernicola TaxID=176166 RepID=A0ABR4HPY6_9EURO